MVNSMTSLTISFYVEDYLTGHAGLHTIRETGKKPGEAKLGL
jgi:hypothetical protein